MKALAGIGMLCLALSPATSRAEVNLDKRHVTRQGVGTHGDCLPGDSRPECLQGYQRFVKLATPQHVALNGALHYYRSQPLPGTIPHLIPSNEPQPGEVGTVAPCADQGPVITPDALPSARYGYVSIDDRGIREIHAWRLLLDTSAQEELAQGSLCYREKREGDALTLRIESKVSGKPRYSLKLSFTGWQACGEGRLPAFRSSIRYPRGSALPSLSDEFLIQDQATVACEPAAGLD
jgi:hypothetical protein